MPNNMKDIFSDLVDALEVLQQDETIADALNTLAALTLSLADKSLSPGKYWALSMFNLEAAKRIKEIAKSEQ